MYSKLNRGEKHMLYKNMSKLLLFIILLMSISVVSAVDYSTDVTQEMGFNDLDAVSYSNDLNEVIGDRGSGSFTDLQTIIDNTPAGSTMRKHLQEAYLLKLANRLSSVDYFAPFITILFFSMFPLSHIISLINHKDCHP